MTSTTSFSKITTLSDTYQILRATDINKRGSSAAYQKPNKKCSVKIKTKPKPFDKQHLLEQLNNEKSRNCLFAQQNANLQRELSLKKTKANNWSQNQVRLMIQSLVLENGELAKKVGEKMALLKDLSKKKTFTAYLEGASYYGQCKEQLSRLKGMLRAKNNEKRAIRKQRRQKRRKIRHETGEMLSKLDQQMFENEELEEELHNAYVELKKISDRYKSKQRDRLKLEAQIAMLKAQLSDETLGLPKKTIQTGKGNKNQPTGAYGIENFNQAVKIGPRHSKENKNNNNNNQLSLVPEIVDSDLEQSFSHQQQAKEPSQFAPPSKYKKFVLASSRSDIGSSSNDSYEDLYDNDEDDDDDDDEYDGQDFQEQPETSEQAGNSQHVSGYINVSNEEIEFL